MKKKTLSRLLAAALSAAMLAGLLGGCKPAAADPTATPAPTPTPSASTEPEYIPAPYTVSSEDELISKFLEPVFYENEGGPTIGVTLVGVIHEDGKYFRDLNNNQKLDDFEDWRLDAQTRAEAMAKALTDNQLTHQVVNCMAYSPVSTKKADVVDGSGNPDWTKLYAPVGGFGASSEAPNNLEWLNSTNLRTFVLRSNPETEVAVWFNNGLEQYSEYYAIANNEVAVPYFTFTNPIAHGMPGSEGVTAAALGDGNADLVLTDAQYDRVVMWAKGIDGLYGPQVDLVTDPRWSRNSGTYGEREDMASEIAKNLTIGYQNGDQGMVEGSVLLTIKHFPGDGAAFNGFESHGQTGRYRIYSTENSLADYQLKPFIAAFEAGAAGVMPGYSQPIVDERIAPQSLTYNGKTYDIRYGGRGNAFNEDILLTLLREALGFDGLINSDSLSMDSQQGVEDLDFYERTVQFIKAGCDCGVLMFGSVSFGGGGGNPNVTEGSTDPSELLDQALAAGDVTRADLERAAANRLKPQAQSGNLDNPYRDLDESVKAVNEVTPKVQALAEETHLKSVVLMKNSGSTLPMADTNKKVYIQGFNQKSDANIDGITAALEAQGFTVVDDYAGADIAYLRVTPTIVGTGRSELAILDLAEDVETPVYDNNAKRTDETAEVTTVQDMKEFKKVADAVHANGGKVIGEIVATSPWILTNMEPYCDVLLGTFSTSDAAIAQVVAGTHAPTGKLPITMVADASVIALVETDLDGEIWDVCVSPNDVPGYVKDQHMDKAVLDASPSGSYAYKDADGNLYVSGFGLTFEAVAPSNNKPAGGNEEKPSDKPEGGNTTPAATADAVVINYDATPDAFVGKWTLTGAYANGEMLSVKENACFLEVEKSIDNNKLVDEPRYIHADAVNLSATMSFDSSISGNEYKCSSNWEKWTTVDVKGEGDCDFFGANQFKIRDDDEGVFFEEITGVAADELLDVIAVNKDGQLLVGYADGHIENDPSVSWEYVYIFSK